MGDDGAARIQFTLKSVKVETRFETTGEHAEWDSEKKKSSPFNGFKRFESLVGHSFSAIVGPDGAIRELKNAAWPAAAKPGKGGNDRDERAAAATHDPTAAKVWLDLIFTCSPAAKDPDTKQINLLDKEPIHFHADGTETVDKYLCSKWRMHSTDREHAVPLEKTRGWNGTDMNEFAQLLAKETRKRGRAWFSRKAGCLVKTEFECATESSCGKHVVHAEYRWQVQLTDRGFEVVKPPVAPAEPTPTK